MINNDLVLSCSVKCWSNEWVLVFRSVCDLFLLLGRLKGPSSSTIVQIFQLPWLCFLSHVITRSKQLDLLGKISQLLLCHIANFWQAICKIIEFKDAGLLEEIPNSVTSIKLSRFKHLKIVPFLDFRGVSI